MPDIQAVSKILVSQLQEKIDRKTKPLGSLGLLEQLALRIGLIQNSLTPSLKKPAIVVFAADHGAVEENISAYPRRVTAQMVLNFLNGGAAINVFARQHGIDLLIVDAGVDYDFGGTDALIHAKIAAGTRNYLDQAAMTRSQCEQALSNGGAIVSQLQRDGCNIIGFGEMGIGNTASASLLMSAYCGLPLERCVGAGAGLDAEGVQSKLDVLRRARQRGGLSEPSRDPLLVMSEFGGFEIAMLCGALLRAAELGMIVLVDGFTATSALLAARAIDRNVLDYCVACHRSAEPGHTLMLKQLNARPLLDLNLRLGEGTGAALAYPIVLAAVNFLNHMATFESAGISGRTDG